MFPLDDETDPRALYRVGELVLRASYLRSTTSCTGKGCDSSLCNLLATLGREDECVKRVEKRLGDDPAAGLLKEIR